MKILALTSVYPQPDDGKEIVTPTVKYFCDKWVEMGHDVIVIHNNTSFPRLFYCIPDCLRSKLSSILGHNFPTLSSKNTLCRTENGVSIYRLPLQKIIPHGNFNSKVITLQIEKIKEILKKEQFVPDVIISHWANPQVEMLIPLKNEYASKVSLVFHGDCSDRNIERFNIKEKVKYIDAIGCRNKMYALEVQKKLGLKKEPFICYSGIPDELAEKRSYDLKKDINFIDNREFIYVGRLVKYKNVDTIIKALEKTFPAKDFVFHIVGEGAEEKNLANLSREFGLAKNIVFHGQLPRDEVFELMEKCLCFCMVSDNETFGMVYIEAMLAGCVTIASKDGGVDGVIVDGKNGFLARQGNVDDLALKIKEVFNLSAMEREGLRRRAVETAVEFSDSNVAYRYLNDVNHRE